MNTSNAEDDLRPFFGQQNLAQIGSPNYGALANITVGLDIKSVINQFLEECSYRHPLSYLNFYTVLTHFANYIEMCEQNSK